MFERFSTGARAAVAEAYTEAAALGSRHIGTEHLLLGIARENEGVASRILLDFDVDADKIRSAVVEALGRRAHLGRRSRLEDSHPVDFDPGSSLPLPGEGRSFGLLQGWLLFGVSLGIGVLVGWAIWGL
jgi:Clp amino terminal domain, pathogenicity island component